MIPPVSLRAKLVNLAHTGHLGIVKTKGWLRQDYWWPGLDIQVERLVRECTECCRSDKVLRLKKPPIQERHLPNLPWEEVALDLVGPIQGEHATPYIFVLMDFYSKWPEVKCVSDISTKGVIKFLDDLFSREGYPKSILSDNGVQFCSGEMEGFFSEHGIEHKKVLCTNHLPMGL